MRKNKPEWLISLGLLFAAAAAGLIVSKTPPASETAAPSVAGDRIGSNRGQVPTSTPINDLLVIEKSKSRPDPYLQ